MSSICKIASPMFYFLVDISTFRILNYIHQVTSRRQRCPDVALIRRSKEYRSTAGYGPFHPHQHFAVTTLTIYVMLNWFACDLQILLVDLIDLLHWIIVYWRLLCIILNCGPYRQYGFCFIKASEIIEFKPELKFGYRCARKESGFGFESYHLVCAVLAFFDLQRHELAVKIWKSLLPSPMYFLIHQISYYVL